VRRSPLKKEDCTRPMHRKALHRNEAEPQVEPSWKKKELSVPSSEASKKKLVLGQAPTKSIDEHYVGMGIVRLACSSMTEIRPHLF